MAIEPMRLVVLSSKPEDVYTMIDAVYQSQYLHPELADKIVNEGNGGLLYPKDRTYENYLNRCERIIHDLNLNLDDTYDRVYTHHEIEAAILEAENQYDTLHELSSGEALDEDDKIALKELKQYDLESLEKGFITLRFGRIPKDSYSKIILHADEHFVFTSLHQNKHYNWIAYISSKEDERKLDAIFDSLYFEPIAIPMYSEDDLNQTCIELLDHVYGYVKYMAIQESYLQYICVFDNFVTLNGFVTQEHLEAFQATIPEVVKCRDFDADAEAGLLAPTLLKNNWFAKPFEMFVEMYGLPQYGGFDPTFYFALTYSLLFGLMFGDLGQGFVLFAGGLYLYHKKGMVLGGIATRIGMFSMVFGVLFGSVFGNETLLHPLLEPFGLPIPVASSNFTMTLLLSAVALGAVLILSSISINIVQSLKHRNYAQALFSQNGLSGFILYGFVMGGLALNMLYGIQIMNPITISICVGIPLICILLIEPLKNLIQKRGLSPDAGWGGYLIEGIFELLEVVLSFVTNTMSFLRVGGFVLSHAGMMVVVMTLNEMSGQFGIIVMILGNILVIALEGLIVGIQTLRLEYYEMFSRYYSGGGKAFNTLYKEITL